MAVRLQPARPRTLADAGLDGAAITTFKADARSSVWLVDTPQGRRVVKRFEYSPLRQALSLVVGNHPAARELRRNRLLRESAVRVVPIVDGGVERHGAGCRAWLATPLTGSSLHHLLGAAGGDGRRRLIDAAARLTADLISAGFFFKDLKPSNVLIDEAGEAWLIDVGSARPGRGRGDTDRMLAVMDRVLGRAGAAEPLRRRFREAVGAAVGRTAPPAAPHPAAPAATRR